MIRRSLLGAVLLAVSMTAKNKEPVFFSWHAVEYTVYEKPDREVTAQLHFRTRDHFSTFSLLRYSVYGSQRLPKEDREIVFD